MVKVNHRETFLSVVSSSSIKTHVSICSFNINTVENSFKMIMKIKSPSSGEAEKLQLAIESHWIFHYNNYIFIRRKKKKNRIFGYI